LFSKRKAFVTPLSRSSGHFFLFSQQHFSNDLYEKTKESVPAAYGLALPPMI